MGLFSSMVRPKAQWGPTDDRWYYPGGSFYGGIAPTSAGVSVDSNSALRLLTVYNCIKVLYNCVSQMPCHLMQKVDGVKAKATDHPLYLLVRKFPNSWMSASEFWGLVIVHISTRGNFLAFKLKYGGKIQELLPIHPDRVREIKQNPDWSITYTIAVGETGGETKDYTQDDVFHLRGMSLDGVVGLNPIEYHRESIGLGLGSEKFLSRYFGRGVHPSAVIKNPHQLDPKTFANMRAVLKEKYEGLNSTENQGFMFLDDGMDVTFPSIKLVDAQFLELNKFNEAQICGMFGVPLMLVQAGDNPTTFASASEFKRNFVDMTITPIAVNLENGVDRSLIGRDNSKKYFAKFNVNSLLRGNITERFAAYQVGINSEFLCPDEVRDWEEMNPIPDGSGAEFRTRTSTIKESDKQKNPEKGEEK